MKFVITGATSFLGLELIDYLLSNGHSVVAVCRPNSEHKNDIPNSCQIEELEMKDYQNYLTKYQSSADVFIHLAWAGTGHDGRDNKEIQKENVVFSTDCIVLAKQMGCKLFVESGSQAEYGSSNEIQKEDSLCKPFSEYGKAKLRVKECGFQLAEQKDIKYMHLRIFSLFGENDHPWTLVMSALDKMLANESVDLTPCTQNWNFLYVKDAVRMIVSLCEQALKNTNFIHEVYNIASKDTRTLKVFVERMKKLTHSSSILNFGANHSQNMVSLQPDMSKTLRDSRFDEFHSFDKVINKIINKKTSI